MAQLVDRILEVMGLPGAGNGGKKARVAMMVNNLGGSSVMELHIAARAAHRCLVDAGVEVARTYTGEPPSSFVPPLGPAPPPIPLLPDRPQPPLCSIGTLMTSLEMPGLIITVMELDALRTSRLDAATSAPSWPAPCGPLFEAAALQEAVAIPPPTETCNGGPLETVLVLQERDAESLRMMVLASRVTEIPIHSLCLPRSLTPCLTLVLWPGSPLFLPPSESLLRLRCLYEENSPAILPPSDSNVAGCGSLQVPACC